MSETEDRDCLVVGASDYAVDQGFITLTLRALPRMIRAP